MNARDAEFAPGVDTESHDPDDDRFIETWRRARGIPTPQGPQPGPPLPSGYQPQSLKEQRD